MKKITVTIDPKLIERIENHREEIDAAIQRTVKSHADKIRDELMAGGAEASAAYHRLDWMDYMDEQPSRPSIRVVMDRLPYMGGGIITTLHIGRKRK